MTTHSKQQQPALPTLDQELQQTVAQVLQQAENHRRYGQIQAAEDLYQAILEIQQDHPDANYNLGVLSVQSQKPRAGLPFFRTAVTANPGCKHYWLSYVDALIQAGQINEACQALALGRRHGLHGDDVEELARLLSDQQQEKQQTSATQENTAAHLTPDSQKGKTPPEDAPRAKAGQAPSRQDIKRLAILHRKGRPTAIEIFARDLTVRFPNHGLGWKTLGAIQDKQGLFNEALQSMQKAVNFLPDDSGVHNDLAVLLHKKGRLAEAEIHFNKALEIKPALTAAMCNLGNLLRDQGRFIESETILLQAIKLESSAQLYNNLGATLLEADRIVEAESSFRRAIRLTPGFALAHINLGVCLRKQGRLTEATDHQRKAIKLDPHNTEYHSNLLFTLNYTTDTASFFLEEARQYDNILKSKAKKTLSSWQCSAQPKRLRVGIVSGDLYNHPVGFFLESILGNFDSDRVELIAYPTNPKSDDLTTRIKKHVGAWKPLFGMRDEDAARTIHADGVHVLLDLSGHTSHNRLPMFAWKPAPVQASWLGYFATTGVSEIDYFLADKVGVPESQKENFTEALWYLPDTRLCFTAPVFDIPVAPLPALAKGHITFGCFQLLTKVGDEVLKVWSSILNALPDARLRWQCRQLGDPEVVTQLIERLQHYGIDSGRVTFFGSMPRVKYLAAHSEVDLILDTFPFPGGTTTCEALWMGVPTLTLAGNSLLSRQGASILTAAGLSEWVATSKTDYIEKAIAMASDLDKLASLRTGLRTQVLASPLFDAKRFARNFEEALWGMWQENKTSEILLTQIPDFQEVDREMKLVTNTKIRQIKYDDYISLGNNCVTALALQKLGIRKTSFPLDWVVTPLIQTLELFKNGFKDFYPLNSPDNYINPIYKSIHQPKKGMDFAHFISKPHLENFAIFNRRIKRLYDVFKSDKTILFIYTTEANVFHKEYREEEQEHYKSLVGIINFLKENYPGFKFHVLAIHTNIHHENHIKELTNLTIHCGKEYISDNAETHREPVISIYRNLVTDIIKNQIGAIPLSGTNPSYELKPNSFSTKLPKREKQHLGPLLSVIITTHQRPFLLKRAMASIRYQNQADVQMVVVSDEHNSDGFLAAQALMGPLDIFINHRGHPGPAESRNLGLQAANGRFIVFLDDDDSFTTGYFARLRPHLLPSLEDILFTDATFIYETRTTIRATTLNKTSSSLADVTVDMINVKNRIPNNCLIYPRDSLQQIRYDSSLILFEDWDFLIHATLERELVHCPLAGPNIHKNDRSKQERRGAKNDDKLIETILIIYKKWPGKTLTIKQARQAYLVSLGVSLPLEAL